MRLLTVGLSALVLLLVCSASSQADVSKRLVISGVKDFAPGSSVGATLSWEALETASGSVFLDVGGIHDNGSSTFGMMLGVSTDAPLPVFKEALSAEACVGFGYATVANEWLAYVRYPLVK